MENVRIADILLREYGKHKMKKLEAQITRVRYRYNN
jgi:hypothetical protein